ncbi:MAG: DNA mismatch repair endonuclease MutL [Bacteroidales bacterium]|nr:DNA mismatch repair endonuclease MutL [Bacteroidales bacterium]MBN2820470.1 DNA mismatch repair endonuclease MutL [Bacteroidales bacterium]
MADIIQLLPDSVANQIAAGEVIQRPASVIKELVENAVDAGADNIKVLVKDAGKTLIQVIDNGSGMSETDARLAFERHATSKIKTANDLFEIRTKGFRGEALASIASIAHVTLKTRQPGEDLGTQIIMAGSELEKQEPVSCPAGTNFQIKNLFFNVPARRKFLKSNTTEFKHILNEFQRIILAHPNIEFELHHNNEIVMHLPQTNVRQRIIQTIGKQLNQTLNKLENDTSLAKITGFIGKPECARKTTGEQFFFINQRYMRHPYFHRAIMKAYEGLIPGDSYPSYFIYFDVDPHTIDVNIHPTKTEIKFENEQALFQIITAAVKEALGKANSVPSIDFETHGVIDIPVMRKNTEISVPEIPIDYTFNPFEIEKSGKHQATTYSGGKKKITDDWEKLYQSNMPEMEEKDLALFSNQEALETPQKDRSEYLQLKGKYILTQVKSGLMLIDQRKAHVRILFEQHVKNMAMNRSVCQRSLYPAKLDLNHEDYLLVNNIMDDLNLLGFDINDLGSNTIVVNGTPDIQKNTSAEELLETLIEEYKQSENTVKGNIKERLALSLAKASAVDYGKTLTELEMQHLVDELFACENPNYTPTGKKVLAILNLEELEKLFNQ